MKKVALALAAVMSAALVVPLAACGGGGFDIDDYALDLETYVEQTPIGKEFTSATPISDTVEPLNPYTYYDGAIAILKDSDGSHFYNIETGQTVTGANFSEYETLTGGFIAVKPVNGSGSYQIYSPDAELLFNGELLPLPASVDSSVRVIDGKAHMLYRFAFESTSAQAESKTTYKYGTYNSEELNGKAVWKEYTEEELAKLGDVSVGDTVDAFALSRKALVNGPMWSPLAAYEYTSAYANNGTLYRFYKSGEYSGSFVLPENGALLGSSLPASILGTSVFYGTQEPVDAYAQDGYNFIRNNAKYQMTYYRYDIKANSVHEIKSDYIFGELETAFFNVKDQTNDAAMVTAYLKKNGVANSADADIRTLIIDENGSVAKDISDLPFGLDGSIIKLKANRYLINDSSRDYIVDKSLNIVAAAADMYVAPSVKGVVFSANGMYGLLDYDGKVVIDNLFSQLYFAGDKAYAATAHDALGEEKEEDVIVALDGSYKTVKSAFFSTTEADEFNHIGNGLIVKKSGSALTVYNYSGTALTSVEGVSSATATAVASYRGISIYNFGGKYYRLA